MPFTTNYNIELIDFDTAPWHDKEHSNWKLIDAAIGAFVTLPNLKGVWTNSTAFIIGDLAVDGVDGKIYEVLVAHTSAATPTLFSADRTANPTFWQVWLLNHTGNVSNPHAVTKAQVGLTNVDDLQQQPLDATLTAYAALTGVADRLPYFTGADAFSLATFTAFARTLLDDATAAAMRTTLGLVIGTNVLPELAVVPQAEAEAGTATTERIWTAQRVGQSITALTSLPRSYLAGLQLAQAADTDHDITIAVGEARDNGGAADLTLANAITKQIDAAWVVGTDLGGLDTGTVTTSSWYHLWLIKRSDTGVVDVLFSLSATAPTMPTNYDKKRRIGAVLTDGSSNILGFVQVGDMVWWKDPPLDHNATIGTTAVLITLSVPLGFNIQPELNAYIVLGGGTPALYLTFPSVNDEAGSKTAAPLWTFDYGISASVVSEVSQGSFKGPHTNTSSQVRAVAGTAATTVRLVTLGWTDRRGKDD